MSASKKRHPVTFLAIAAAAALLALALGQLGLVQNIELLTYDRRVSATAHATEPHPGIVLVEINDDSIRRMEPLVGRWPWPRVVHSFIIDYLTQGGAKVIVYDVLFAERDQQRFKIGDDEWTGEESDQALIDATAKAGMVVMAGEAASAALADPSKDVPQRLEEVPSLNQPFSVDDCVERRPVITPPFAELAKAARAVGHTLFVIDANGALRRSAPFVRVGDRVVPSLALVSSMIAQGVDASAVRAEGGVLAIGTRRVPLVEQRIADFENADARACRVLIAWRGPTQNANGQPSFQSYSAFDLLRSYQALLEGVTPELDPAAFKDKVVVIGATAQGLFDVFTTPFPQGRMTGPEAHANIIDAFGAGRSVTPWSWGQGAALALGLALVVAGTGMVAGAWVTGVAAAIVAGVFIFFSVNRFAAGTWVPVAVPAMALVLAYVGDLAWKYLVEGREKRQVKALFSRYVSKDVYDQLMADPTRAALGGARRNMTVLFSDVRGFTAMSEKGTPEAVVGQLNEYFTRMVHVVFEHEGTLDKFVGDMVMALYGAPLDDPGHAEHAVQTALAMCTALNELNVKWSAEGRPNLDIGIGINTGDMVAGNIGSDAIMSYTVIGDAVNLGARLESLNKEYGSRIIISDATRSCLKGKYDIRPLGDVIVKGKSKKVAIFEVKPT